MGINLVKGQSINLEKSQYDLAQVTIGLGWDVRSKGGGLFSKLLSASEAEYDLDAVAFLLNANGKVANLGDRLVNSDVIFFNNMRHSSGNVWLTGDNRTGAGDGDDEQIIVCLDKMSPAVDRIVFIVQIYEGRKRGQHFGGIENCFIRAVDRRGQEIAKYNISTDASFNNKRALLFAEVYRREDGWKFRALGESFETDSFVDLLEKYL